MKIGHLVLKEAKYKPKKKTFYTFITPKIAKSILALNHEDNRKQKDGLISSLAHEITSKEWKPEVNSIKFYNGKLVDGQNRLHGVIESNQGVMFEVEVFEFNPMYKVDTGCARSAVDVLKMKGVKDAGKIVPILNMQDFMANQHTPKRSATVLEPEIKKFRDDWQTLENALVNKKFRKAYFLGPVLFSMPSRRDACIALVRKVSSNTPPEKGTITGTIRKLITDRTYASCTQRTEIGKKIVSAIELYHLQSNANTSKEDIEISEEIFQTHLENYKAKVEA